MRTKRHGTEESDDAHALGETVQAVHEGDSESQRGAHGPARKSRREFLGKSAMLGASSVALTVAGARSVGVAEGAQPGENESDQGLRFTPDFLPHDVPVRHGLGILIVGGSSGLSAQLARHYAEHGACIVLAARRTDRLEAVADEVDALGGTAHVITNDARDEAASAAMVGQAVAWLATQGKVIDLMVLAPVAAQVAVFGPEVSTGAFRKAFETIYFAPLNCLKYALPHLKEHGSTLFYFNSISSSVAVPLTLAYTSGKHAWLAVMRAIKLENPEITIVSSQFNSVDTEGFDKETTYFDNDKRYCPSFFKTYGGIDPAKIYPTSIAVQRAVDAIESGTEDSFLSMLNKAAWLIGFTRQDLGWLFLFVEQVLGFQFLDDFEPVARALLSHPRGQRKYMARIRQLANRDDLNELEEAAGLLASLDPTAAVYLLALNDAMPPDALPTARQIVAAGNQGLADGTLKQLCLALSAGVLTPSGISDHGDGLAPITQCDPAGI